MLKPVGQIGEEDQGFHVSYLSSLAREAREAREDVVQAIEDNINVFRFGKASGSPAEGELVVNEIQNAIISTTQIQTQEPPAASLEPVETGEPPLHFWAGPQDVGLALFGLQVFEVASFIDENGVEQPPTPLDPMVAGQLKALAVPEEVSPALPMGMIRPEWIAEVSDQSTADVYQTVLDIFWERSQSDLFIRQALMDTNIQGTWFGLYEFDDTRLRHTLKAMPFLQVYADATVRDIADMGFFGFDLPVWADEAKTLYPDLAEDIDAEAKEGNPTLVDQNTQYSSTYDRDFQRPHVVLRVFWLRNQMVPLSKEEAIELGEIVEVPMEVPSFVDGTQPEVGLGDDQQELAPGDFAGNGGGPGSTVSDSREGAATEGRDSGRDNVSPAGDDTQSGPLGVGTTQPLSELPEDPAGTVCILAATGEPCYPGDPAWPTRIGIRQLVQLGGKIVDDRECEHWDIPVLHNVNIPFPTICPWGQGEPERLKGQQAALNRAINSMVTHGDFHAAPLTTMSQSMYDSLPPQFRDGRIKPGMVIVVPDDQWMASGGKIENVHEPAALSPAHVQLFPLLKQLIDDNSGHTDVMQGKSAAGDSGKKVEMLQSAGSGIAGFKAKRTGDMVARMTHLMLHSLIWRLDVDDLEKIVSKYPRHVLEAIHGRARAIEWNVKVVVQAGAGLQVQKRQLAQMDYAVGAISMQTLQEESGRDPRLEDQRKIIEAQKMAQAGMVQPGQEGEKSEGGEKKAPGN